MVSVSFSIDALSFSNMFSSTLVLFLCVDVCILYTIFVCGIA